MADFKAAKVVAALPAVLEADTVYFIRAGSGFDIKVTNGTGTIVALDLNQLVASAFGKLLVAAETAGEARTTLELGTAATRNVGEGSGNVMQVGAFGLGSAAPVLIDDFNSRPNITGFWTNPTTTIPNKPGGSYPGYTRTITIGASFMFEEWINRTTGDVFFRVKNSNVYGDWHQNLTTLNILSATGQSALYPMTQKAVTDAINARGFADASGILTATSGALSNDMSAFLSLNTREQMRDWLGFGNLPVRVITKEEY